MPTSVAYLNGQFLPLAQVHISPLDRGFLFADGIYEVIPVFDGHAFRLEQHLRRLADGLAGIRLTDELAQTDWPALLSALVSRNGGGNLVIYLQVTRGAPATRDHSFPVTTVPTVFAMASTLKPATGPIYDAGIAVITQPDIRWGACHLKSIALLPNVLARQQAVDQGAVDTILVRDGLLLEGSAANLFLVRDGVLLTPPKDWRILPGITRELVLELAVANAISYEERDLPMALLEDATEVWLTSSTKELIPVTRVDGRAVGDGKPGPLWKRMRALYQAYKQHVCDA